MIILMKTHCETFFASLGVHAKKDTFWTQLQTNASRRRRVHVTMLKRFTKMEMSLSKIASYGWYLNGS